MFEFKTANQAIPANQLFLYYFILLILYLLFSRKVRISLLSLTILTLFNQGFLILIEPNNILSKVLFIILTLAILFNGRFSGSSKTEKGVFAFSLVFTVLFYLNYIYHGTSLFWASFQYYKYFIPFALFFGIRGLKLAQWEVDYYADLIIKLMWFQIAFSVVKLIVLGLRENITGSIADTGGGIGVGFAMISAVIYWMIRGQQIRNKDWLFIILVLLVPIASNKRAIWFVYPVLISFLTLHRITRQTTRKISYAFFLLPVIVYFGFRLNPTLNPERILWGSFDPQYALNYAFAYSGVAEDQRGAEYAQGRLGASTAIVSNTLAHPFETESLIGFAKTRSGRTNTDVFVPEDYGLRSGTMISAIGILLIQVGWLPTLFLLLTYLGMIATIPDKKIRGIFYAIVLWDLFFYSGSFISTVYQSVLLVLAIRIAATKSRAFLADTGTPPKRFINT